VPVQPGIAPEAWVDPSAQIATSACIEQSVRVGRQACIGEHTLIASGACVGECAQIGADCRIGEHAVIAAHCSLGNRVVIGPGVVIGADGFGFVEEQGQRRKLPHVGTVLIEDDVEIGANSTVARATLGATRIGRGSKIDCLVHVAHNVTIEPGVVIAAQVGLSGSVRVEEGALLGGQVGVSDHVVIGRGAQVAAKSGVGVHVEPGARVAGYPAIPIKDWLQSVFLWRRLKRRRKSSHDNGSET
jgi:UDP-3-O-[3-hydroxymyristoyl] glucosamine N-acyltransferase